MVYSKKEREGLLMLSDPVITLVRGRQCWMAVSDEHIELFGTDSIPTAFPASVDADTVLWEIAELNPGCYVRIAS